MKKSVLLNAVLAVIFLSNLLTACSGDLYDYTGNLEVIMERSFPTSEGKELRVKGQSGDIVVTPWDKPEVYFKILGNEKAKERLEFEFENNDSFVGLMVDKKGSFFNWFSGTSLRIEIKVPKKYNAKLHTSGGDIKLAEVKGEHQLKTSGGDIECKNFVGSLDASTSGGDIELYGGNAEITAHTSGGDIMLDYSGENKGIDLSTSGGDISVKLPPDFNASMEISTSGGDVSCNLTLNNATKISEHKLIADLNNGGEKFYAHTSGGDIDVRKK